MELASSCPGRNNRWCGPCHRASYGRRQMVRAYTVLVYNDMRPATSLMKESLARLDSRRPANCSAQPCQRRPVGRKLHSQTGNVRDITAPRYSN